MNIKIESNFQFSVASIQYSATGELCISLIGCDNSAKSHYQYSASLGTGQAEEKPTISLLQYVEEYSRIANIKAKAKRSYYQSRSAEKDAENSMIGCVV